MLENEYNKDGRHKNNKNTYHLFSNMISVVDNKQLITNNIDIIEYF
jgi:hypothetical protein